MFKTKESLKNDFLQRKKEARQERACEKDRELAALCIQRFVRNYLKNKRHVDETIKEFDEKITEVYKQNTKAQLKLASQVFELVSKFLSVYRRDRDQERIESLCRYFIQSLESDVPSLSYVGIVLTSNQPTSCISQIKKFLLVCMLELKYFNLEIPEDHRSVILRLHTLVAFTSPRSWIIQKVPDMDKLKTGMNQLCANLMRHLICSGFFSIMQSILIKGWCKLRVFPQSVALTAIATLTMRPVILSKMSDSLISSFLVYVLSVPAIMHHLNNKDQIQCINLYRQNKLFTKCIVFLNADNNLSYVFNSLKGNYSLCLLANLVELANIESEDELKEIYYPTFTTVVTNMLKSCQQYVVSKNSNTTYWHPILGWFEQPEDQSLQEVIPLVKKQLSYLWTGNIITQLICKPLNELLENTVLPEMEIIPEQKSNILLRPLIKTRKRRSKSIKNYRKLDCPETKKISSICWLYQTALCTLSEIRSSILTGFCYKDKQILYNLHLFLNTLGPNYGLKPFLDHIVLNVEGNTPELQMLILFCDCLTHYVTILDDIEMYEKQDPFKLVDFVSISYFLNQILYKTVIRSSFDLNTANKSSLFNSMHNLLMLIYRRDCQRSFCPEGHWLIKELRVSNFLTEIDKKAPAASLLLLKKMPHIVPHFDRVVLFRKFVSDEKTQINAKDTSCTTQIPITINIHRLRIVEDGYQQLSKISPKALKGIIRVRFINEQGLDEAGIDQDGVFKEFLEETIKRVFDPSLNLFKTTTENRLYPSSTSYVHENHLQLFEFVGRMLGKAVYEGIVVDVPFASFFISQFCGHSGGVMFSWLDELASLDQDLYRSLTMVKHYDGDVSDLELTFSLDENVMGKLTTYELKPGGRAVSVDDDNKISYIHLMARFRMFVQIKDQIAAFTKGFRSIINPDWLTLFSTPEWQKLISGDNVPVNLKDLRRNTQYYGGFHDNHRVICWLWDILEKDFNDKEKGLFLKFVTSCSKPPLLGFAHLEPPFSIRCVEVGDDDDTGDTIGSVIRGFFTIHKKDPQNRLPTSSTCFNLLKLPNYQKKSTLRDKLRYAVVSNTGFELS